MMRDILTLLEDKAKPSDIELVKLSYGDSALSPIISGANLREHLKLAQGYCDRYNKNEGDKSFNYAGHLLHNILFGQFRAPRPNNPPNGPVGNLIISKFKSWDNFKDKFTEAALKLQGSGWIYLARDGSIKTIQNHQTRSDIVLLIDMWEHSYRPDYSSDKKRYLKNIWQIIDWNAVNTMWGRGYK